MRQHFGRVVFLMVWCIAWFVAVLALSGCQTVPPEVIAANALQDRASRAVALDEANILQAYDKELRSAYSRQLDLIMERELQKHSASGNGMVPIDVVTQLLAQRDAQAAKITATLDSKLEEFRQNPHLDLLQRLNAAEGRYLRALDQSAQDLQAIIDIGVTHAK